MYTSDITIGTNTYSLTTQRASSSVRSDASQPLESPVMLNVGHEVGKLGRVSTVVYLDSMETLTGEDGIPKDDTVRAQFKIQYDPTLGRVGLETEIERLRDQLIAFLGDATNWTKLLNKES